MITLTFLLVCAIEISGADSGSANLDILEKVGVDVIKDHWKALMTSWRIEELGLGALPVNNFLRPWNVAFNGIGCVRGVGSAHSSETYISQMAPRPAWVRRFDTTAAEQQQEAIRTQDLLEPLPQPAKATGSQVGPSRVDPARKSPGPTAVSRLSSENVCLLMDL